MEIARAKVTHALELGGGHTILSTGMTGDDARMARAVCEAGVKMLEPNHPGVALARGHKGVVAMHASEQVRHEITMEQMAEVTRGVRAVCPKDTYITVAIPGGFTEIVPLPLTEADFQMMALAGADGLHTHKSSIEDLEEHTFGLPAETPEEVATTAKMMQEVGTDMIGLMTGMSYEGVAAGEIHPEVKERLCALVESVSVPTLAEGGINATNFRAFKDTKVNILVIGTSIDNMVKKAAQDAVREFLAM